MKSFPKFIDNQFGRSRTNWFELPIEAKAEIERLEKENKELRETLEDAEMEAKERDTLI